MKKKILYVITQTEWGGAQKYIYELITSEQAKNYDILVAVGDNKDKTLIDKLKAQNVPVRVLKHLVRPISPIQDILVVFELKKLYQEIKPDIIHTSSSKPSVQGSIAFKLSKLENTKLIHTVHGWVFNESISTWKKKMYLILEKITAKYKSLIIFISNHDKQSAIDNNITIKNSVIIHNGIDLDESALLEKSVAREKLNLPQDKIIIGTVANLYKTKGLEYFIEATNLLVRENKNIISVVIGDGELKEELKNLIANYGLQNNFLLLGRHKDAQNYLKAFDVYAISSTKEGVPYSLLEAMKSGVSIVTTNVGGIPEVITNEESGLLVNPQDGVELASNIKVLIEHEEYSKQLAEKAKQKLIENFSKDKSIEKTFSIY